MTLRAGEVASRPVVNLQTLRYYERRGILPEPDRSLGGHRLYDDGTVLLLRVVKAAQALGFSLEEIAELIASGHTPIVDARISPTALAQSSSRSARRSPLYNRSKQRFNRPSTPDATT